MTIGPAPMIRIVEMSVLLGITSAFLRIKKERAVCAPAPGLGPARGGLRPDSVLREGRGSQAADTRSCVVVASGRSSGVRFGLAIWQRASLNSSGRRSLTAA